MPGKKSKKESKNTMSYTVKELINELSKYPGDMDVYVSQKECKYSNTLKKIEEDMDGTLCLEG